MKNTCSILVAGIVLLAFAGVAPGQQGKGLDVLEGQFRTLPMEARRLTGPLFWMHGDAKETKKQLEFFLEKVAESNNGCFTAESRPHSDWLGPRWYEDLAICLGKAKKLNLKMWIFDEKWWPSQMVGGKVPVKYGSKLMEATSEIVVGPKRFTDTACGGKNFIAAVAGREVEAGIDGGSLVDLSGAIRDGKLTWTAPPGRWKVMKFTWKHAKGRRILVDGASKDCVDWFIKTVYQPHYDRFKDDFGKTIVGYFYDEPETHGDWGTEVIPMLKERKADWKKALVAWKFRLAGKEQAAARYAYHDAYAEALGRTMYGGMTRWCRDRNVISMGHFLEHHGKYLSMRVCGGNMFQLQKYSDMGAIDLVCRQMYPGQRPHGIYQTPKLGSSISHVYNKADDITMCEIFGAYGQDITYEQMKWLTDQMQVRGVNFMIPHSINPRGPQDLDCPPYFYNGGFEARWPLYRVYSDYTNRLSLLLAGGYHVCPVAMLFLGNSKHVGKATTPEDMTSALQDALFDCDWMPYDVFENDTRLRGKEIHLHRERYKILVVPPVEVIPPATLEKAKAFLDAGGVIIGHGILPSVSATLGRDSKDVAKLREAIWGQAKTGLKVCKTTPAGGRSYFLPAKPTPEQIQQVLTADAKIHPTLEVLQGRTNHWLHVLHRVKNGHDVLLVCNQDHKGDARRFKLRIRAAGEPECWDAMRNEITAVDFKRVDANTVDLDLTLEPNESVLLVFRRRAANRPARITAKTSPAGKPIAITRTDAPPRREGIGTTRDIPLNRSPWVWYPETHPRKPVAPGTIYFRKKLTLTEGQKVESAHFRITAYNNFVLFVNGVQAGKGDGSELGWQVPKTIDIAKLLRAGENLLAVAATNGAKGPVRGGLIGRYRIFFEDGKAMTRCINRTWKASKKEVAGWNAAGFDDEQWPTAREVAAMASPVAADPFTGRCKLPANIDLKRAGVYLEMDNLPRSAASVKVNGVFAGGVISRPWRLDVTRFLKPGKNEIRIEPFAPAAARLVVYPGASGSTKSGT